MNRLAAWLLFGSSNHRKHQIYRRKEVRNDLDRGEIPLFICFYFDQIDCSSTHLKVEEEIIEDGLITKV